MGTELMSIALSDKRLIRRSILLAEQLLGSPWGARHVGERRLGRDGSSLAIFCWLFDEKIERHVFSMTLPANLRKEALRTVDCCYESFNNMLDGLTNACNREFEAGNQRSKRHVATR